MCDRKIGARSAWRVDGMEPEGAMASVSFGNGGEDPIITLFFIILNKILFFVFFELAQLAEKDGGQNSDFY